MARLPFDRDDDVEKANIHGATHRTMYATQATPELSFSVSLACETVLDKMIEGWDDKVPSSCTKRNSDSNGASINSIS